MRLKRPRVARQRFAQEVGLRFDGVDWLFGLIPGLFGYAAFVAWADVIVRALRGEDVSENWKTLVGSASYVGSRAMVSSTNVRASFALNEAVSETRQLLREAADEAEARDERMREFLRQAAADADARDRRAAEREDKLYRVAALTLMAAIVTLVVTIIISL